MTPEQTSAVNSLVLQSARLATLVPLDKAKELVADYEHTRSFAPFFDPTAWMQQRENVERGYDLARAFLAFRRALEELKPTDVAPELAAEIFER